MIISMHNFVSATLNQIDTTAWRQKNVTNTHFVKNCSPCFYQSPFQRSDTTIQLAMVIERTGENVSDVFNTIQVLKVDWSEHNIYVESKKNLFDIVTAMYESITLHKNKK